MYSIVRIIIGFILFACSIVVIRKFQTIRKRSSYTIAFVTTILIIPSVLGLFPFENLFITFDTPESSYEYYNFGNNNIQVVIEGENSAYVLEQKSVSEKVYSIIPKTESGWKIGTGFNNRRVAYNFIDSVSINVYQYEDTNDYFISIYDMNGGKSEVSDDYNTSFYSIHKKDENGNIVDTSHYAYVPDFNSDYCIIVNGNRIPVKLN